ncbi:MAG TPA: GDSL-type esterase/lipase family protein [Polyangia bacterium]|nr:GDSL-type esterase/lipase family protein [Polyangia bacterium]
MARRHVVLLGDSIFDNASYTGGAPDVISHLGAGLPAGWRASLLAVDGSVTDDLREQIEEVPADATDLILSIGGNDALSNIDILGLPVSSTAEALEIFGERASAFRSSYVAALDLLLALGRPTTVCTIYEGNLQPQIAGRARVALTFFNDVILRAAFERSVDLIDLRLVCTEASDFANPIEPSGSGGAKIARAIRAALGDREARRGSLVTIHRG